MFISNSLTKTKNLDESLQKYIIFQNQKKIKKKNLNIISKLFKNILPKTCENFRLLCTGEKGRSSETATKLHYKGSVLHRIVSQGWIQGGGIVGEFIYYLKQD